MRLDPTAEAVVRRALAGSPDLARVAARLRELRAAGDAAAAGRWPVLSTKGGPAVVNDATEPVADGRGRSRLRRLEAAVEFRWELDLFGRLAADRRAAAAQHEAAAADLAAARVLLAHAVRAEIVRLRSAVEETRLAQSSLDTLREIASLETQLRDVGLRSDVDLGQLGSSIAAQESALVPLRLEAALAPLRLRTLGDLPLADLAALVSPDAAPRTPPDAAPGATWGAIHDAAPGATSGATSDVTSGATSGATRNAASSSDDVCRLDALEDLPAEVPLAWLRRRLDVAAAESRLRAGVADTESARAAIYPAVALTAGGSTRRDRSRDLGDLLAHTTQRFIGVELVATLFDAGRRADEARAAQARAEAAAAEFTRIVLLAAEETEGALARRSVVDAAANASLRARRQAEAAAMLGNERLRVGIDSRLAALQLRREALERGLQHTALTRDRCLAALDLNRALALIEPSGGPSEP